MTDKNVVPEVYAGISQVLKALRVEKNGTLPGNMGGKSYFTASDLSDEVKRQFVEADLIIFPYEKVTKHEVIETANKKQMVVIGVEGSYKIVSTRDGSSEVIAGVGDGTAMGTSVASNIASTNALKNALLRTFLVTEQSVEDQAKQEHSATDTRPEALKNAAKETKAVANRASTSQGGYHAKIKSEFLDTERTSLNFVKSVVEEVKKATKATGEALYEEAYNRIKTRVEESEK